MAIDSSSISICWLGEIQSSAKHCAVLIATEIQRTEYRCSKDVKKQRLKSNWWFIKNKTKNETKARNCSRKDSYEENKLRTLCSSSLLMCGLCVGEWMYLCMFYCLVFFLSVCCIDYFILDFFSNLILFVLVIQWRICLRLLIRRP